MPHGPPAAPILYTFESPDDVKISLVSFILRAQKDALDRKGRFTVALSGGSLPKMLAGLVGNPAVKWAYWQVYYADERAVPLNHDNSNHKLCKAELFDKVPELPSANIHTLDESQLDDLEELSDAYEKELIREFAMKDSARFPVFDLILLGMGPDGHTASLFPGHPLLSEEDRWVAYIEDSPKPPPKRITLTLPVINHALRVAFVATGEGKAGVLQTILDKPEEGLPSSRIRPAQPGQVFWFVDAAAGAKLQYPKTEFAV